MYLYVTDCELYLKIKKIYCTKNRAIFFPLYVHEFKVLDIYSSQNLKRRSFRTVNTLHFQETRKNFKFSRLQNDLFYNSIFFIHEMYPVFTIFVSFLRCFSQSAFSDQHNVAMFTFPLLVLWNITISFSSNQYTTF